MKLHANARTCPKSRALIARRVLEEGWSLAAAAEAAGVSVRTAGKWVSRFESEGARGLVDRSSAPRRRPRRIPAQRIEAIRALRKLARPLQLQTTTRLPRPQAARSPARRATTNNLTRNNS
jgi:transposase